MKKTKYLLHLMLFLFALQLKAQEKFFIYPHSWTEVIVWDKHAPFVATQSAKMGAIEDQDFTIQLGKDTINSKHYLIVGLENSSKDWKPNGKLELTLTNDKKIFCKDRKFNRLLRKDSVTMIHQSLFYLTRDEDNLIYSNGIKGLLIRYTLEDMRKEQLFNNFEVIFSNKTKEELRQESRSKIVDKYAIVKRAEARGRQYEVLVRVYGLDSKTGEERVKAEKAIAEELEDYMKAYENGDIREASGRAGN